MCKVVGLLLSVTSGSKPGDATYIFVPFENYVALHAACLNAYTRVGMHAS